MLKMLLFIICEAPSKNSTIFKAIFDHFYPISLEKFAIVQNFPILHLWDTTGHSGLVNNHGK